jgi:DNA-binding NarL/FixJ family response regulator
MPSLTTLPDQDRLRVLAADSTAMGTQLLVQALSRESQFQMIESPSTGAAILSLVKREKPHVAVLSAKLDDKSMAASELVREIRIQSPGTRVIILLDVSERSAVTEAFRTGAQGVFCRTEPFRLLARCIQCVHMGQVWASSNELRFILEALAQPTFASFPGIGDSLLSAREIDVVRCVAEGLTNRAIAQRLMLTEHTVKNYMFRIFDKLGVSSRVEVLLYALGKSNATPIPAASPSRRQSLPLAVPARAVASAPVTIRKTAI